MRKIASPQELTQELRVLLAQASEPNPSRERLAGDLALLANRVADEAPADYRGMSLSDIALAVRRHWKSVNYAAKPYLDTMLGMDKIDDDYGYDSGRSIVSYFLSNATQFKGPEAKAIKAELKRRLKSRQASALPKLQGPAFGGPAHRRWSGLLLPGPGTEVMDPFTRQWAHWLYTDKDGWNSIGYTTTQFVGPDTGNIYQLEVVWSGPQEVPPGPRPKAQFWFAARKPNGAWLSAMSKKFSTYDAAHSYWADRLKATQQRLHDQMEAKHYDDEGDVSGLSEGKMWGEPV